MLTFVGQHHAGGIYYTSINNNGYFQGIYALYFVYPPDIFGSPNNLNYVKVKTVQTCSWGNENVLHETYIIQFQYHF
jgi:hypothetical protein